MERPLRQKPSPYPGAVAWSRDNILAVGQERSVALLNPADLVDGDAGFVRLADDTAPGSGAQDAGAPKAFAILCTLSALLVALSNVPLLLWAGKLSAVVSNDPLVRMWFKPLVLVLVVVLERDLLVAVR